MMKANEPSDAVNAPHSTFQTSTFSNAERYRLNKEKATSPSESNDQESAMKIIEVGKPKLHYPSEVLLRTVSQVRAYGATKYADNNWMLGFKYSVSYDAAQRHLVAFFHKNEDLDPESGLPHIAHAICNLEHILYTMENHPRERFDDRYKPPTKNS